MSSVSYHVSNLLEKMTSTDKDFSLAPLVRKVKEPQLETMVDTLCSNMVSDKEQLRDISSMGVKTLIAELPLSSAGLSLTVSVCKRITSQLIGAMGKQEDVSVQLEALDILSEMLGRLSGALVSFHSSLLHSLLPQLTSPRMAVRKRSILALGHLVPCCSSALFSQLTEHLLTELAKAPPTSLTRTYIQCLATISRQGAHRVGEHLEKLIPVVVKCPKEMSPHVATVTKLCLKFMTFDPNYNYDDEQDEEDDMDVEDVLDEESDDEYSDDDDMSWKVRRSSVKCLEALIESRRDLLLSFYASLCPALLARFKEREENVLLPPVVACVDDTFYKITSEALLVTQQLVRVMRPHGQNAAAGFDPRPFVREVFSATLKRLKATDIDQEVKERAITCMGHMVCHLGDHMGAELQGVLAIFLERLKNEITRLTAVRTFTLVAASPIKADLSSVLPEALSVLGSFLRKNQRALKLGSLACLTALVTHHAAGIKPAALEPVLSELPALVDEDDMHVSQVSVALLTVMAAVCPSSLAKISSSVLPGVFRLVHSPLLQGGALAAILDFIKALVGSKTSSMGYSQLLRSLTEPFHSSPSSDGVVVHRQSYRSVARCVAALTSACPKETPATVSGLIQEVKNPGSPESARVLALLSLGEVGRSGSLGGSREVQAVILEAFTSSSEESCECPEEGTRNLVAECLGKLTSLEPAQLLPRLKQQLKAGTKCEEDRTEVKQNNDEHLKCKNDDAAVLQRLDRLVEPLKATCTTKVKAGSVKQEFEKQDELRRSAMRAVAALLAVPDVERSPSMAEFANQIRTNADMASIYQSVQGGEAGESMDMS
ncbi:hypothetical protein F2P81_013341 [Scophthalmus maximus]|uniref:TATA-binding protein interacting (TIP20) domain-containing protein n=1 Tax=Scophthalmus maximus TaxID=52904 RepID=A0A6A4SNM0_SCOMX|nr:hypothetical protein F2P81_013341 [Scophthalmus maximus]